MSTVVLVLVACLAFSALMVWLTGPLGHPEGSGRRSSLAQKSKPRAKIDRGRWVVWVDEGPGAPSHGCGDALPEAFARHQRNRVEAIIRRANDDGRIPHYG